jgi:hypothetical protein
MPTPSITPGRHRNRRTLLGMLLATALGAATFSSCGASAGSSTTVANDTSPDAAAAPADASSQDDDAATPEPSVPAAAAQDSTPTITFADKLDVADGSAAPATALIAAADGGSLSVTAGDGTVFTLEVPADALADDTTITATPVTITAGITGAAATYAVRFEPEGMRFLEPAQLHIEPPSPIMAGQALAFSTTSDGSEPLLGETAGRDSAVVIDHFSIWGVVDLAISIRDAVVQTRADSAEVELFNQVALNLAVREAERAAGVSTDDTDLELQRNMTEYLDTVVNPLIATSDGSCAGLRAIASKLLNYYVVATRNELVGVAPLAATVQAQVVAMDKKCEADAIAACKEAHDPQILINYWINAYTFLAPAGIKTAGRTLARDIERAKKICSAGYTVTGGGGEIVITGAIDDVSKPFLLEGSFTGGSAIFSYTPADEHTGSYTINGGGSGAVVTGSGAYVIEDAGDTLTLTQNSSSCVSVSGVCRDTIEVMTLTPK